MYFAMISRLRKRKLMKSDVFILYLLRFSHIRAIDEGKMMSDIVIKAIQQQNLNTQNLNFLNLRDIAGIDNGLRDHLDWGRRIIPTQELLNQYLYSYGLMVERQWNHIIPRVSEMLRDQANQAIHLFDYGCGQALGSLLLLEKNYDIDNRIKNLTLVEPSAVALQRATALMQCKLPQIDILSLNKNIDEVIADDLNTTSQPINMHIFSNVLDIDSFDQFQLMLNILRKRGTHYIVAVSHDRDFAGGSPRLESLFQALLKLETEHDDVLIEHSDLQRFTDSKHMKHLFFALKIEIR